MVIVAVRKRYNDGSKCGLANDLAPRTPVSDPLSLQTGHSQGAREGLDARARSPRGPID